MDWLNDDIADLQRAYLEERAKSLLPWVSEAQFNGTRVLVHNPPNQKQGNVCIVYAHGGGWVAGSPETHLDITSALSLATGLEVFSVDYTLAPQAKALAQVAQIQAVVAELPNRRIILAGDSAGASLAAAAHCMAPTKIRRTINALVLFYGYFGLVEDNTYAVYASRENGLDSDCIGRYLSLAGEQLESSIFDAENLAALGAVPLYVSVGDRDPLLGSSLNLVQRLQTVPRMQVTFDQVGRASHGFLHGASERAEPSQTLKMLSNWLGRACAE